MKTHCGHPHRGTRGLCRRRRKKKKKKKKKTKKSKKPEDHEMLVTQNGVLTPQ